MRLISRNTACFIKSINLFNFQKIIKNQKLFMIEIKFFMHYFYKIYFTVFGFTLCLTFWSGIFCGLYLRQTATTGNSRTAVAEVDVRFQSNRLFSGGILACSAVGVLHLALRVPFGSDWFSCPGWNLFWIDPRRSWSCLGSWHSFLSCHWSHYFVSLLNGVSSTKSEASKHWDSKKCLSWFQHFLVSADAWFFTIAAAEAPVRVIALTRIRHAPFWHCLAVLESRYYASSDGGSKPVEEGLLVPIRAWGLHLESAFFLDSSRGTSWQNH